MVEELLAQGAATKDLGAFLPWVGLLLAGVGILAGVWTMLRRRLREDQQENRLSLWSLDDLRAMRARGDLSEQEFEQVKARILAEMGVGGDSSDVTGPGSAGRKGQ